MDAELDFAGEQGRNGYTDAMSEFKTLWQQSTSFIDIMLVLREHYPEDMINTVLEEARVQGFI